MRFRPFAPPANRRNLLGYLEKCFSQFPNGNLTVELPEITKQNERRLRSRSDRDLSNHRWSSVRIANHPCHTA